jgi:hypothetical protein
MHTNYPFTLLRHIYLLRQCLPLSLKHPSLQRSHEFFRLEIGTVRLWLSFTNRFNIMRYKCYILFLSTLFDPLQSNQIANFPMRSSSTVFLLLEHVDRQVLVKDRSFRMLGDCRSNVVIGDGLKACESVLFEHVWLWVQEYSCCYFSDVVWRDVVYILWMRRAVEDEGLAIVVWFSLLKTWECAQWQLIRLEYKYKFSQSTWRCSAVHKGHLTFNSRGVLLMHWTWNATPRELCRVSLNSQVAYRIDHEAQSMVRSDTTHPFVENERRTPWRSTALLIFHKLFELHKLRRERESERMSRYAKHHKFDC